MIFALASQFHVLSTYHVNCESAIVGVFIQEKALLETLFVIVKYSRMLV